MSERSCPSCHEPVLAHQTLCPACRTPVPSEAGPVATDSSAFTFTAPPPRRAAPAPPPEPTDEPGDVVGTAPVPQGAPPRVDPPAPAADRAPEPTTFDPFDPVEQGTVGPFVVGPPRAAPAPEPTAPGPDATAVLGGAAPAWAPEADATAVAPAPAPSPAAPAWDRPAWDPPSGAAGVPLSAGTLGTPGAAVLDERGNLPGGIVGLVAAALVTIGVFLPWIAVEGRDVSGWAASGDAKVLLGIAGLATVIAALLIGGARSLVLRLAMLGLGVVALGLGVFEITSANGIDEFDVSPGRGLFLVLAGGLALAVAGVLTRHRRFLPSPPR